LRSINDGLAPFYTCVKGINASWTACGSARELDGARDGATPSQVSDILNSRVNVDLPIEREDIVILFHRHYVFRQPDDDPILAREQLERQNS